MQTKTIKGLAGLATLLNRADLIGSPTITSRPTGSKADIEAKTIEKIGAAIGSDIKESQAKLIGTYMKAAIRDAHNLGHAEAFDQNNQVERLLEKQYDARTKLTMPAVVAGVMEQLGLSSMTLDLALMATVFDRCEITYTVSDENVIEYSMRPVGEAKE